MSNVQTALPIEEYNAMVGKIEELTKEVEFYEDTVNVLLEDIEDYKKELMGSERYARATELSDEDKEKIEKLIRGERPKSKLIYLRTQKVVEE